MMRMIKSMGILTDPATKALPTMENIEELVKAPLRPIQSATKH
jgi:hypothetical protein